VPWAGEGFEGLAEPAGQGQDPVDLESAVVTEAVDGGNGDAALFGDGGPGQALCGSLGIECCVQGRWVESAWW